MPYALAVSMLFALAGVVLIATANSFGLLVLAAMIGGVGSAIFHPEASRVARLASGGRLGFAQSLFQVGGNLGTSIGPLAAAYFLLPRGQGSVGVVRHRGHRRAGDPGHGRSVVCGASAGAVGQAGAQGSAADPVAAAADGGVPRHRRRCC